MGAIGESDPGSEPGSAEDPASQPDTQPVHVPPAAAPALDDPARISASRILEDRPDVLRAYYKEFYEHGGGHDPGWAAKIGGVTAEAYATYWYAHHGKYEGYSQGPTTAQDNVSLEQILTDRPDVLRAYYKEFYGANDRHSDAWIQRVGGDTPQDYAKYWYETYGKWEGYAQSEKAAFENIDLERLLRERPDVVRSFYEGFYGPNNDRHSSAWVDRVGGDTLQDYGKYWYKTYGKAAGYTQAPSGAAAPPADTPDSLAPPVEDPSLDPWNHPAIYPDWKPPYDGWTPPDAHAADSGSSGADILAVGKPLGDPDPFG